MSHCAFLVEVALRQRMFACGVGVFAVRTNAPERFLRSKVQKGMLILNLDVPYLCSFNFAMCEKSMSLTFLENRGRMWYTPAVNPGDFPREDSELEGGGGYHLQRPRGRLAALRFRSHSTTIKHKG